MKFVEDEINLPPGFRFHPTDEELITDYLSNKVLNTSFDPVAVAVADLNKCEPWDLPKRSKLGGKAFYFFCARDRKYPSGIRTNRATEAGYWKATGKDREIRKEKMLVGMKKTLVFYRGRAPKGNKTEWVMHEYRLEGNYAKNEWVICRVFSKSSGKITSCSTSSEKEEARGASIPPLTDSYVTCFSKSLFQNSIFNWPEATPSSFYVAGEGDDALEGGYGNWFSSSPVNLSHEIGIVDAMNTDVLFDKAMERKLFEECLWN